MAKKKVKKDVVEYPMAGAISVKCPFNEIVSVDSLKPNPANPNIHPEAQIALLARMIAAQGWRDVITISNRSGMIVTGHARYQAAKMLQVKTVPIGRQDFASWEEEHAHLIADNKIAELAETDGRVMADVLVELDRLDYDLSLTALSEIQIKDYIDGPLKDIHESQKSDLEDYMSFVVTPEERKEIEMCLDQQEGNNRTEQLLFLVRKKSARK